MTTTARPRISRTSAPVLILGLVLAATSLGCGGPPEVSFVEPNRVMAGEASTIRIRGDGFEWDYNAFLDSASGTFEADIGDTPLEDVTWIDAAQLEGTVPTTVASGLYDITVRTTRGEGTLADAILVEPAEP